MSITAQQVKDAAQRVKDMRRKLIGTVVCVGILLIVLLVFLGQGKMDTREFFTYLGLAAIVTAVTAAYYVWLLFSYRKKERMLADQDAKREEERNEASQDEEV